MPSRIRRSRRVVLAEQEERRRNLQALRGPSAMVGRNSSRPYDNACVTALCDYGQRVIDHQLGQRREYAVLQFR